MTATKLNQLIKELKNELEKGNVADKATQTALKDFEHQIELGMAKASSEPDATLIDTANLLEARFANEHPTAEAIIRNIIDTLHRIGV